MSISALDDVKHIVLVLSGKGGVGKSSVTTQLALSLANQGYKVGVLDIDLTGPSMPRMMGLEGKKIHQSSAGWVPVHVTENLKVVSLGFLLQDRGDAVIWRGPKKTAMIRQFLKDVMWGQLDYLIVDTPPGTSDEHISIAEEIKDIEIDGAVVVTTPQDVATADVRKEINFCKKVKFPIIGVVENMSGYICPHCAECTNIFSAGGGQSLATQFDLDFLGSVPIDPTFVEMIEAQHSDLPKKYGETELAKVFQPITEKVVEAGKSASRSIDQK